MYTVILFLNSEKFNSGIHLLVITEAIMDLHQRIDSIKMIASSVVMSNPAEVAYGFRQVMKEIIISEYRHKELSHGFQAK